MTPSEFGACACSQVRRTSRKLSSLYDGALAAVGLTVTQHALLVNVAREGEISRTALAEKLGMERTTLTRNLRPLEKEKLIVAAASEDRRERLLRLSGEGRRKLRRSYALWEEVQQRFVASMGKEGLEELERVLRAAEKAADAVIAGELALARQATKSDDLPHGRQVR